MAKLYFYYAAMNAGKATILLQSDYNYRERGMETPLFTPDFDARVGKNLIASRIGLQAKAIPFDNQFNFFAYVKEKKKCSVNLKCVLIDEAHFLRKNQVRHLCNIVDVLNIPVLTYGLRTDFQGNPFEGSLYLMSWAENLIEVKTICKCGKKAIMNQRIDSNGSPVWSGEQTEIGGNERYVSLCRAHFFGMPSD